MHKRRNTFKSVLGRMSGLLVLIAPLILTSGSGYADKPSELSAEIAARNVQFNQLTSADGLSHAWITDIVQDRRGFIWIATQEGLNRYDGYQLKVYEHIRADSTTLSQDFIRTLLVDDQGVLWVGTKSGVNRYDADEDSFERHPFASTNQEELSRGSIRALLQTRDGAYWIGTEDAGLYRIDPTSGDARRYGRDSSADHGLPDGSVLSLYEDRKGNLWIGMEAAGLFRFDPVSERFVSQGSKLAAADNYLGKEIRSIYEDQAGFVWIGSGDAGISRFDPRRGRFERLSRFEDPADALYNYKVRDIVQDSRGTIWIATDGGLVEWREAEQSFVTYHHDERDARSLISNRLTSLFVDASGVLWIGTWEGLSRWNYFSDTFNYYRKEDGLLPGNLVSSIAESRDGTLWIATYGTGLARLNTNDGLLHSYRHDSGDAGSIPEDNVMSVHVDPRDRVWVGTRSGGLARLDAASDRFVRYRFDPSNPDSLSGNAVSSIFTDEDGWLWVGTYGEGVNRMAPGEDGVFKRFRHDPKIPESLSGDRVLQIASDRRGSIWVGTEGAGLNRYDAATGGFRRFQRLPLEQSAAGEAPDPEETAGLTLETVTDFTQDQQGALWIATLGKGLVKWTDLDDPTGSGVATVYSKADGLPTDTIYGVLQGQSGEIWLSSNRGLIRFDPNTGSVRQFDSRTGLRESEFHSGARLRSRSGRLLFGGPAGLVGFYPGELPVNARPPGIVLKASSRQEQLMSVSAGESPAELEINYLDRFLAFDFVALDFMSSEKNQYRYMLEGFDNSWIDGDSFRRATYTNLPSGQYTFRVQAANNDGVWNIEGAAIRVTVVPAPWNTWWAYLGYFMLVASCLLVYVRAQQLKLKRESEQRLLLEHEVGERTSELAQRNSELENLNEKLAEASVTDSLTGLRNRRYVDQFISSEVALFERNRLEGAPKPEKNGDRGHTKTMFFMMIDLDGFKLINDRYGHHAGDLALVQVKTILEECSRTSDTLIRWGGDEFMVIGFASGFFGAKILAERIRESIAAHRYDVGNGNYSQLSASIGVAPYPLVEDRRWFCGWELVAALADQAAYIAKANGRNGWVSLDGSDKLDPGLLDGLIMDLSAYVADGCINIDSSLEGELVLPSANRKAVPRAVAS